MENGGNNNQIQRSIQVITSLIEEAESKGNGGLKSMSALIQSEQIQLHFVNQHNVASDIPSEFTLMTHINISVLELIYIISQQIKVPYDEVVLEKLTEEGN